MRELTADVFISLDGFASGVDVGPYFGYHGPELETWIHSALDQPQVMIMGRVTYEALAGFSASATDEVSVRMTELPKLVFSSSLTEPLVWRNTRVVNGDLCDEVRALKQQAGDPLRSIGSLSLVKSLMNLALVDRLRLMVFPLILAGDGTEPIYAGYLRTGLELVESKVLDSRLILLEYRPEERG